MASLFKDATVTGADVYLAAREICSRLYVGLGGDATDVWEIQPFPATAAISVKPHPYIYGVKLWTLSMPAIPMDARLTRTEADQLIAYVTHELGHALFTDFAQWKRAIDAGISHLVNALEDVRIELRLCNVGAGLPNARAQLELLTEYVTTQSMARGWKVTDPRSLAFNLYQYAATRPDLLAYNVPSMPDFAKECPADMLAFMDAVMARLKACNSTADCVDLALWIKDELQGEAGCESDTNDEGDEGKGDADGESDNEGEGEGEGEDADGEGDNEGEGEGKDNEGEGEDADGEGDNEGEGEGEGEDADGESDNEGEGEGEDADGEGDNEGDEGTRSKGKGEGNEGEGDEGTPETKSEKGDNAGAGNWYDADMTDAGQNATEPNLIDMGIRISERMGKSPFDVMLDNADVTDFLNTDAAAVRPGTRLHPDPTLTHHVAGKLATPAKLRRDVTRAVRSPEQLDTEHYQTRGRFDARSFVRAETGAENVFRRRNEAMGQTAAVSLLLDLSGSMKGYQAECAACLALHLGDALRAAAVPFEIAGFIAGQTAGGIIVPKAFSDAWTDKRDAVAAMANAAGGGTAMLPGIKAMTQRLRNRAGVTRRVLLVLTDGADQFSVGSNRAAIAAAEAKGVEIVGIGMLYDASGTFSRYVQVDQMRTIATQGLGALLDVLDPNRKPARKAA